MKDRKMMCIKIGRLSIQLKRSSPEAACALTDGMGNELMVQLAKQQAWKEPTERNVSSVVAGTLQASRNPKSSDICKEIASQLGEAIIATVQKKG